MTIAHLSPELLGAGLRWPEHKGIAQAAAPDRREIARRLLLLAPILGDKDAGEEAVAWFAQGPGRRRRSLTSSPASAR